MTKDRVQLGYVKKLGEFLNELNQWGKTKFLWEYGEDYVCISLYTDGQKYHIKATKDGYLGCVASCRKPRPGEDWTRGNDLSDGKLDEETWNRIINKKRDCPDPKASRY